MIYFLMCMFFFKFCFIFLYIFFLLNCYCVFLVEHIPSTLYFIPKWQPSFATLISFYLIFFFHSCNLLSFPFVSYDFIFLCVCFFMSFCSSIGAISFELQCCMVMVLFNSITMAL